MARHAEFDRELVLREAMEVFWKQGYNATSIKDVIAATKIQPGSIYWAFGNKKNLFLAAIDCYHTDIVKIIDEALNSQDSPITRIKHLFLALGRHTQNSVKGNGCMLVNSLLEVTEDEEVSNKIINTFLAMEKRILETIIEAQTAGEISASRNPQTLAKLIMTNINGLRVYSKISSDPKVLGEIVEELILGIT